MAKLKSKYRTKTGRCHCIPNSTTPPLPPRLFEVLVTSPAMFSVQDVLGGTITIDDNLNGTFTMWSYDPITAFKFHIGKTDITRVRVIKGLTLTTFDRTCMGMINMTHFIWNGLSNITDATGAWYSCTSLTSLTVNTGKVTDFTFAWMRCQSLTSFPNIDTSKGTNFINTWADCNSLTSFPALDFSSGTTFANTWRDCSSLVSFPAVDMSVGTNFNQTWRNCTSMTTFGAVDISSATMLVRTWEDCRALTTFPVLDTSNVTDFSHTWDSCVLLTSFPLLDTSSGDVFTGTWKNCASLTTFPLIDTTSAITLIETWSNCSSLTSFPLIDTSGINDLSNAWMNCSSLTVFPLIDTASVTSIINTWYGCSALESLPALDTSSVSKMSFAVANCTLLECMSALDTTSLSGALGDAEGVFENCPALIQPSATGTSVRNNDDAVAGGTWVNSGPCPIITYTLEILITSTLAPTVKNVTGGSIGIIDNLNGTYTLWSGDVITHFKLDANKMGISEIEVIKGDTLTSLAGTFELCRNMTTFTWHGACNSTDFSTTWNLCNNLTPFPIIDTSNGTNFRAMCNECTSLTTFPLIDTSNAVDISSAWRGCTSLTAFPALDTSNVTTMHSSWVECTSLTSFPAINTSKVTEFINTWAYCNSLECLIELDTTAITTDQTMTFDHCTALVAPDQPTRDALMTVAGKGTWTNAHACPPLPYPIITDFGDESHEDNETNVILTGVTFGTTQGTGQVIFATEDTWAAVTTKAVQVINSWNNTSINLNITPCSFVPGPLYVYVTNDAGHTNDTGYAFAITRLPRVLEIILETTAAPTLIDVVGGTINIIDKCNGTYALESFDPITEFKTDGNEDLITKINGIKTDTLTTGFSMFSNCTGLIEVTAFDTSNMTSMHNMFINCSSLTTMPASLDTAKVTVTQNMFNGCTVLAAVPSLNTINVISMNGMFHECKALTTIPPLDMSNVTMSDGMFFGCSNITTVPAMNMTKVEIARNMFKGCTLLEYIPAIQPLNVYDMYGMFENCTSLTCLTEFNTTAVTDGNNTFLNCPLLAHPAPTGSSIRNGDNAVQAGNWINSSPCPVLPYLLEILVTSPTEPGTTDVVGGTITAIDNLNGTFTLWSTDTITSFKFGANKTDITTIEGVITNTLEGIDNTFNGCTGLTSIVTFDISNVITAISAFGGCTSLITLPALNTVNITDMTSMFEGCIKLQCLMGFDTTNAVNVTNVFLNCPALVAPSTTGTPIRNGSDAVAGGGNWANVNACPLLPLESYPDWDLILGTTPSPTEYCVATDTIYNSAILTSLDLFFFSNGGTLVEDVDIQSIILYEGTDMTYGSYFMAKGLDADNFVGITSYNNQVMLYEVSGGSWNDLGIGIPVAGTLGKRIRFKTVGDQASLYVANDGDPIDDGLVGTATYTVAVQSYPGIVLREHPTVEALFKNWSLTVLASRTLDILVTSPTPPTVKDTVGGTVTVTDNGGGTYSIWSSDTITHFKIDSGADITEIEGIKTDTLTDMTEMFAHCILLTTVTAFDTSNVTTMEKAFMSSKITTMPVFNTTNVLNMNQMFAGCTSLSTIPLFDTVNVTDMADMFNNCGNFDTMPLLDTSSVTTMARMFSSTIITTIPLLNTSNVTNMQSMFRFCSLLIDIPLLDTSSVEGMIGMFDGCTTLTTIPLLDMSNVTQIEFMFNDCSNLESLPALITSSVHNFNSAYKNCSVLTCLTVLDTTSIVSDQTDVFVGCTALVAPDVATRDALMLVATKGTWTNPNTCPYNPLPIITDFGDEDHLVNETNVVLTGTDFETTQGVGKVLFAAEDTWAAVTTTVEQTINTWGDTSIDLSIVQGALTTGPLYVYVTNNTGNTNTTGYAFTLTALPIIPAITDFGDEDHKTDETGVILTGTDFEAVQGTGKVLFAIEDTWGAITTTVEQTIVSWTDTSIELDIVPGTLPTGTLYVYVTNNDGNTNPNGYMFTLTPAIKLLDILITTPAAPTVRDVVGGTIDVIDNGSGTYTLESHDAITHFKLDANVDVITKIEVIDGHTLTELNETFVNGYVLTEFIWSGAVCHVISMELAFRNCNALTTFTMDTSSVENMGGIFGHCRGLTTVPTLNTSNTTNLQFAFFGCTGLTSFPTMDMSKVINFSHTWNGCTNLKCLTNLDTSAIVTDQIDVFVDCPALVAPDTTTRDALMTVTGKGVWTNPNTCPYIPLPVITDFGDEDHETGETNVILTGIDFETIQGAGQVLFAAESTWATTTTTVSQTINSWSDTSIDLTIVQGALALGTLYVYVTNNTGNTNATGYAFTLSTIVYAFEMLVTSPITPTISGVSGGTIDIVDNTNGTFTLKSSDPITRLRFDSNGDITKVEGISTNTLTSCKDLFDGCAALTEIIGLDVSNATNIGSMCSICNSLISAEILNTSNAEDMQYAFFGCTALTTLSPLTTDKVTNINNMFNTCSNLTSISFTDTPELTDMTNAFRNCTGLTALPTLNTSKVQLMGGAFYECENLTNIQTLDTNLVTDLSETFYKCRKLTNISLTTTNNMNNMFNAFNGCTALENISPLNTGNVTNFGNVFRNCTSLECLNQLDTSAITVDQIDAFYNCTSLIEPDAIMRDGLMTVTRKGSWTNPGACPIVYKNSETLITASAAFTVKDVIGGTLTIDDLGNGTFKVWSDGNITSFKIDTGKEYITRIQLLSAATLTNLDGAFANCTALEYFLFDGECNVTSMISTFTGCTSLVDLNISNAGSITNFTGTWSGCTTLTEFPALDFSGATTLDYTWEGCTALTGFPAIDTSSVTSLTGTWKDCSSMLSHGGIIADNAEYVIDTWKNCFALICIGGTLNFSSLVDGTSAFFDCDDLVEPIISGTPVRVGNNATNGTWTNAGTCP